MAKHKVENVSLLYVEKNGVLGGYKNELLKEEIPSDFKSFVICSRCDGIMRNASWVGNHSKFMCETCAQVDIANPLTTNRQIINSLVIWCPLKSRGCEWEGHISSSETHLDTCQYFHIECHMLCGTVVRRIDMESHMSGECPFREIMCEHCTHSLKQTDMNLHLRECVLFPIHCTNGCGDILKRGDMQSHREEMCPNSLLVCGYKKYGCGVKPMRKDLDTHTTDYRLQHMDMFMLSGTKSIKEELNKIKDENISIKKHIALLVEENISHRNKISAMSHEYTALECELVSLRNCTNIQYNSLEIIHNEFARDSYRPFADKVGKIIITNPYFESELIGKISPDSLSHLSTKCKELEYLSLFQEKRTCTLSKIFLRSPKCVSGIWEGIRSDPITLLRINHEPIYKDGGPVVVRLTGVYSISTHCHCTINLCIALLNYNAIQNIYCFSVAVKPELSRTVSDISIQTQPWKPQRYERMYILADIPIEDIQKEGVCHMDCINIKVCCDREIIGDSF